MRLPLIKHLSNFVVNNDEDYLIETLEVLEHISEHSGVKDEEIDVLDELISNLYGALKVDKDIKAGKSQKEVLNDFMEQVQGSIDF
tara:strand:- start:142 stop:399 length:258 start_codon:yes stop_codon:yes gene_type:complete